MIKNIVTSDYVEVVIKMKNDYHLKDFIQALLQSGYTISQTNEYDVVDTSEGFPIVKSDYVNIHIRYNNESDFQEEI